MNVLLIDTASSLEFVAAMAGDRSADASRLSAPSHAVTLMESIDTCLTRLGVAPRDLDLLGVGLGPGSFTGIRIAVTTIRMMAQVLALPAVGIATPELFAAGLSAPAGELVLVAFDAKKQRIFGALYELRDEPQSLHTIVPPGDYPLGELAAHCPDRRTVHLLGNGIDTYGDGVSFPAGALRHRDYVPDAARCCRLALRRYAETPEQCADFNKLVPLYGRKSDAEIAMEGRL